MRPMKQSLKGLFALAIFVFGTSTLVLFSRPSYAQERGEEGRGRGGEARGNEGGRGRGGEARENEGGRGRGGEFRGEDEGPRGRGGEFRGEDEGPGRRRGGEFGGEDFDPRFDPRFPRGFAPVVPVFVPVPVPVPGRPILAPVGPSAFSPLLSIRGFALSGDGCGPNSARLFLEGSAGQQRLHLQFGTGNGGFFEVSGPGALRRSCAVRIQMLVQSGVGAAASSFQVLRLVGGVQFVNPLSAGQLVLRSQVQVNGLRGPVQTIGIPSSPQVRADTFFQNQNLNVRTGSDLDIQCLIELDGANGAALRLDDLALEFALGSGI